MADALVSYCCYNKSPKTWWLKTSHLCYILVLETRSLKWPYRAKINLLARSILLEAEGECVSLPFLASRGCLHSLGYGPTSLLPFLLSLHLILRLSEKAMATHSSTLAWKIPLTEEPVRLQSRGSLRVGHDWATSLSLFTFMHWRRKWQPTPVFLPGESQGQGSLSGLPSMGSHRVGHDWSDLAAAEFRKMNLMGKGQNCLLTTHIFKNHSNVSTSWYNSLNLSLSIFNLTVT